MLQPLTEPAPKSRTANCRGAENGNPSSISSSPSPLRLVVVGDVHDAWSERDEAALSVLNPTMVLFVGDFGNEAVQIVAQVAQLHIPKAVILGNHDAWYTMVAKPRKKPWSWGRAEMLNGLEHQQIQQAAFGSLSGAKQQSEASASVQQDATAEATVDSSRDESFDVSREPDSSSEAEIASTSTATAGHTSTSSLGGKALSMSSFCAVEAQIKLLGAAHVGFSSLPVSGHPISILGARPFAKGGGLESVASFYNLMYGMSSSEEFTQRIVEEGLRAAALEPQADGSYAGRSLVLLAHNGPAGLGAKAFNPCGVDWRDGAGDHGDKDLQDAIDQLRQAGVKLPLVCFGHMHHVLSGGKGKRQMVSVDSHGTVYLNAATVPRVRSTTPLSSSAQSSRKTNKGGKLKSTRRKAPHKLVLPIAQPSIPTRHHFMVVDLVESEVELARDVWVDVESSKGTFSSQQDENEPTTEGPSSRSYVAKVANERELFKRVPGQLFTTCSYYDASVGRHISTSLPASQTLSPAMP